MNEFGVVVVVIVSPKREELKLFLLSVSNDLESSLLLTPVLPLWLVLRSNSKDAKACSLIESS